ncbi:uncharacterized protein Ntf-2 isoform X2 [Drosophila pseudoobscura]|uniref:Uncharacterized protein Ntf-2 isoform X2 n=1 Tax=Drosophila pseudoobscura pseudoobscura TaxID=46245 RepID=A0A0R3P6J2_DROPS|nr:uncharacterized protein LOC4814308 isoform X2 [Drosophila pseudoobscura]
MSLNPQYEDIGKGFVQQYYALFDDPANRASVVNFYSCDDDPPHAFSQVFMLKANANSFFVAHDIFRLNIHNTA